MTALNGEQIEPISGNNRCDGIPQPASRRQTTPITSSLSSKSVKYGRIIQQRRRVINAGAFRPPPGPDSSAAALVFPCKRFHGGALAVYIHRKANALKFNEALKTRGGAEL